MVSLFMFTEPEALWLFYESHLINNVWKIIDLNKNTVLSYYACRHHILTQYLYLTTNHIEVCVCVWCMTEVKQCANYDVKLFIYSLGNRREFLYRIVIINMVTYVFIQTENVFDVMVQELFIDRNISSCFYKEMMVRLRQLAIVK